MTRGGEQDPHARSCPCSLPSPSPSPSEQMATLSATWLEHTNAKNKTETRASPLPFPTGGVASQGSRTGGGGGYHPP